MLKCLADIIEGMGFKNVEGCYTGTFLFRPTGNVLKIVADDLENDPDDEAIVRFGVYNMDGDLQDTHTLDQMIVIRDSQLTPVEISWDEEYVACFHMSVQVPVKLAELSKMNKDLLLYDYVTDKENLIKDLATEKIREEFDSSELIITLSEFKFVEKL